MRKHSHKKMRLREAAAPERRPAVAGLFNGRFKRGAAAASAAAFASVAAATAAFAVTAATILLLLRPISSRACDAKLEQAFLHHLFIETLPHV